MATYTDPLTGSGGAIDSNWTVTAPGAWIETASGALQTQSTGAYRKCAYTGGAMDSNDYRVDVTIAYDSNANLGHGAAARWAAAGTVTCYAAVRFATEVYRAEITAGAETEIVLVSTPGTGSVTLGIEVNGTAIEVFVNGSSAGTDTDASIASGTPGLIAYGGESVAGGNTTYATNWQAEDLAAASAVGPLLDGHLINHGILAGRLSR